LTGQAAFLLPRAARRRRYTGASAARKQGEDRHMTHARNEYVIAQGAGTAYNF
jgi:hypothetical protein